MTIIQQFRKKKLKLLGLGLLAMLLAACSSSVTTPVNNTGDDARYDYVLSVDIAADDTKAEIEQTYEGEAIVFNPDAGFAVLGLRNGEFSTLNRNAEANQDQVQADVTALGNDSWAGGFDSWAGGFDSWAGGFDSWAGGSGIWSESNTGSLGVFSNNLEEFEQINLGAGQDSAPGLGSGVVVAVLDTGVDLDHTALAMKLTPPSTWYDFVDNDAIPDDDMARRKKDNSDARGHGTAVAGLVLQVAPQATIMPIRVLKPDGSGDITNVIQGILWAINHDADIINLSLGSTYISQSVRDMLSYARDIGIYIVASTGNTGDENVTFPASDAYHPDFGKYLVGVTSVSVNDDKSSFSTYGSDVELAAPGEQLYTFGPDDTTMYVTGTSFAANLVTGGLALVLGELNQDSDGLMANYLVANSDSTFYQGQNQGYNDQLGEGRLDLYTYISAVVP